MAEKNPDEVENESDSDDSKEYSIATCLLQSQNMDVSDNSSEENYETARTSPVQFKKFVSSASAFGSKVQKNEKNGTDPLSCLFVTTEAYDDVYAIADSFSNVNDLRINDTIPLIEKQRTDEFDNPADFDNILRDLRKLFSQNEPNEVNDTSNSLLLQSDLELKSSVLQDNKQIRAENENSVESENILKDTRKVFPDGVSKAFDEVDKNADSILNISEEIDDSIYHEFSDEFQNPFDSNNILKYSGESFYDVLNDIYQSFQTLRGSLESSDDKSSWNTKEADKERNYLKSRSYDMPEIGSLDELTFYYLDRTYGEESENENTTHEKVIKEKINWQVEAQFTEISPTEKSSSEEEITFRPLDSTLESGTFYPNMYDKRGQRILDHHYSEKTLCSEETIYIIDTDTTETDDTSYDRNETEDCVQLTSPDEEITPIYSVNCTQLEKKDVATEKDKIIPQKSNKKSFRMRCKNSLHQNYSALKQITKKKYTHKTKDFTPDNISFVEETSDSSHMRNETKEKRLPPEKSPKKSSRTCRKKVKYSSPFYKRITQRKRKRQNEEHMQENTLETAGRSPVHRIKSFRAGKGVCKLQWKKMKKSRKSTHRSANKDCSTSHSGRNLRARSYKNFTFYKRITKSKIKKRSEVCKTNDSLPFEENSLMRVDTTLEADSEGSSIVDDESKGKSKKQTSRFKIRMFSKNESKQFFKSMFGALKRSKKRSSSRESMLSENSISKESEIPTYLEDSENISLSCTETEQNKNTEQTPAVSKEVMNEVLSGLLLTNPYLEKLRKANLEPIYDIPIEKSGFFPKIIKFYKPKFNNKNANLSKTEDDDEHFMEDFAENVVFSESDRDRQLLVNKTSFDSSENNQGYRSDQNKETSVNLQRIKTVNRIYSKQEEINDVKEKNAQSATRRKRVTFKEDNSEDVADKLECKLTPFIEI